MAETSRITTQYAWLSLTKLWPSGATSRIFLRDDRIVAVYRETLERHGRMTTIMYEEQRHTSATRYVVTESIERVMELLCEKEAV